MFVLCCLCWLDLLSVSIHEYSTTRISTTVCTRSMCTHAHKRIQPSHSKNGLSFTRTTVLIPRTLGARVIPRTLGARVEIRKASHRYDGLQVGLLALRDLVFLERERKGKRMSDPGGRKHAHTKIACFCNHFLGCIQNHFVP